jgi:hypothetical protein
VCSCVLFCPLGPTAALMIACAEDEYCPAASSVKTPCDSSLCPNADQTHVIGPPIQLTHGSIVYLGFMVAYMILCGVSVVQAVRIRATRRLPGVFLLIVIHTALGMVSLARVVNMSIAWQLYKMLPQMSEAVFTALPFALQQSLWSASLLAMISIIVAARASEVRREPNPVRASVAIRKKAFGASDGDVYAVTPIGMAKSYTVPTRSVLATCFALFVFIMALAVAIGLLPDSPRLVALQRGVTIVVLLLMFVCAAGFILLAIDFRRRAAHRPQQATQRSSVTTFLVLVSVILSAFLLASAIMLGQFVLQSVEIAEEALRDCSLFFSFEIASFVCVLVLFYKCVNMAAQVGPATAAATPRVSSMRSVPFQALAASLLPAAPVVAKELQHSSSDQNDTPSTTDPNTTAAAGASGQPDHEHDESDTGSDSESGAVNSAAEGQFDSITASAAAATATAAVGSTITHQGTPITKAQHGWMVALDALQVPNLEARHLVQNSRWRKVLRAPSRMPPPVSPSQLMPLGRTASLLGESSSTLLPPSSLARSQQLRRTFLFKALKGAMEQQPEQTNADRQPGSPQAIPGHVDGDATSADVPLQDLNQA